jgi:hypothetical protein
VPFYGDGFNRSKKTKNKMVIGNKRGSQASWKCKNKIHNRAGIYKRGEKEY